jgi:lactoylglutathione lyase
VERSAPFVREIPLRDRKGGIEMQFRYSAIFVRDVPRTASFYERAFGFALRYIHPSNGYAELDTGTTLLAFVGEEFLKGAKL